MNKTSLAASLTDKYQSFIQFVLSLSEEQYEHAENGKWTAGQQLAHMVLCVQPLVQVYGMPAAMIEQNFGKTDRGSRSYEALKQLYRVKLAEGGTAPSRFVPPPSPFTQREELCNKLDALIATLIRETATLTDEELDSLQVPHPLLGNLTLREMLYNAIYHAEHHHRQAASTN